LINYFKSYSSLGDDLFCVTLYFFVKMVLQRENSFSILMKNCLLQATPYSLSPGSQTAWDIRGCEEFSEGGTDFSSIACILLR